MQFISVFGGQKFRLKTLVRERRKQIKLRRICRIVRFKSYFRAFFCDIQTIFFAEFVSFAVNRDFAAPFADVDRAHFAAVEKRFAFRRFGFGVNGQRNFFARRKCAADGDAVEMRIIQPHFVFGENFIDQIKFAQIVVRCAVN